MPISADHNISPVREGKIPTSKSSRLNSAFLGKDIAPISVSKYNFHRKQSPVFMRRNITVINRVTLAIEDNSKGVLGILQHFKGFIPLLFIMERKGSTSFKGKPRCSGK